MKITEGQIRVLQDDLTAELLLLLIEKKGLSEEEAMDKLYSSKAYKVLMDSKSDWFYHSVGYVYSYLDDELKTGVFA